MGFLSTLGTAAGTFFGGPIGGTVGGLIGGGLEYSNAQQAASYTNDANIQQAQANRDFQANQAQINRDFQASQTSTAYQRAVADMKAAGLNPMLAYSQGGSHSASGSGVAGAQAQIQNPSLSSAQSEQSYGAASVSNATTAYAGDYALAAIRTASAAVTQAGSSVRNATVNETRVAADVDLIKAQIPKLQEETLNVVQQRQVLIETAGMLYNQAELMVKQGLKEDQLAAQLGASAKLLVQQTALAKYDVDAIKAMGNLGNQFKQAGPLFDLLLRILTMRVR